MSAKGFFVPMARSGRIPKKVKAKEDEGEEGGRLLQVLGSREVDLVNKILNFLDPVSLMRLEATGASMRNFIIDQKIWPSRVKTERKVLDDPAIVSRLGTENQTEVIEDKVALNSNEKKKAVRAWNLAQNWKFGQVKMVKLVSFNCNHEGCGSKCRLRIRITLNPPNPETEDLLPSQIINGDLVVLSIYDQTSANDSVTQLYSIRQDRVVLEIPEEDSLIGACLSEDRSKIAFLYSGLVNPLMLVVVQAKNYTEEVKVHLPISETLSALIHSHPGHGEVAFLPQDDATILFYISGALLVIKPSKVPVIQVVLETPQLRATQVKIYGRHLVGLGPREVCIVHLEEGESAVTEVWRRQFASNSFPPVNLTSLALSYPYLYIGKSHGVLETWHIPSNSLISQFDKTIIISSPRPAILDVRVVGDYIVTANFGPHLCVWQKKALQDKTSSGNGMPGYKLDLKYEQDFYIDQSQIVFIEEMGVKDMEGMTVTRADFWALCKENFERGDREEKARVSRAKLTYLEAKKRDRRDPRKRKIGNAGIAVANKKPSLYASNSRNNVGVEEEDRDEDYSYREDEELVDEREELFEEEGDMWREDEEQDYHYHDGEGLV